MKSNLFAQVAPKVTSEVRTLLEFYEEHEQDLYGVLDDLSFIPEVSYGIKSIVVLPNGDVKACLTLVGYEYNKEYLYSVDTDFNKFMTIMRDALTIEEDDCTLVVPATEE